MEGLWSSHELHKWQKEAMPTCSGEYLSVLGTCLGLSNQYYLTFWSRPLTWRIKQWAE